MVGKGKNERHRAISRRATSRRASLVIRVKTVATLVIRVKPVAPAIHLIFSY